MTILIYDYYELEERASRHLNAWKAWHLILFSAAGIFGILNYVFLQNTMQLVEYNCVLMPRKLEFRTFELPNNTADVDNNKINSTYFSFKGISSNTEKTEAYVTEAVTEQNDSAHDDNKTNTVSKNKREAIENDVHRDIIVEEENVMMLTGLGNETHRLVLDTSRTLFARDMDCQFTEYMPIMSTVFAALWITFFTMCPGGGHSRTGLQQPWRIVIPALLFSLILVGVTGHNFTQTNRGIQDFCAAFFNITNTTTCSAANAHLENGLSTWWGLGGRAAATRAACAAAWGSWACGAALLLARCLTARDFVVRRTAVTIARDPHQKVTPYLKKTKRRKTSLNSPVARDTVSIKSEPTATTELVTASIEQGQETALNTPEVTPVRRSKKEVAIEMNDSPQTIINKIK
ncbi:unnamed protein product [Parnassius mnemosyne]|uniref:Uncharacterized protein n=1 Tax=Parnassius mnemosyne TaxID=213953 RepID=A0AAV1KNV5_9NEOP